MNSKTLLISILSVALSAAVANAQIGVHVWGGGTLSTPDPLGNLGNYGSNSLPNQFAPTDVAGAPGVAQANWNNVTTVYPYANDAAGWDGDHDGIMAGTQGYAPLTDSTGAAVTGMSMWMGGASFMNGLSDLYNGSRPHIQFYAGDGENGVNWGNGNPNTSPTWTTMESGAVSGQAYCDFENIPYAQYNVIMYLTPAGGNGGAGQCSITNMSFDGSGNPIGTVDANAADGNFSMSWGDISAANLQGTWVQGNNYVVFTGNTASDIELGFDLNGITWANGLGGIQIVPTPEPASLALLALGGLLVLPRRKSARA
jgi:hypothetical protein